MKKQTKNNMPLILGITLPILIIIIFAIAQYLPGYLLNPPKENILFATDYYEYTNDQYKNYDIDIKDGKVKISYRKLEYTRQKPKLFIFNPISKSSTEIKYSLPLVSDNKWHNVNIPELKDIKVNNDKTSKDGYTFYKKNAESINVLGLFFNIRNNSNYAISKDGYSISINPDSNDNFYNIYFIGWIQNDK